MVELKFFAIGQGRSPWKRGIPPSYANGGIYQYDASFTITFDQNKVQKPQVDQMIQEQVALFQRYHPGGQIIKNSQRQWH